MKEILAIVALSICALTIIEILFMAMLAYRTDRFRKSLKPFDLCSFYHGSEKVKGRVLKLENDFVSIEDEDGEVHDLPITSIYRI